ncbi:MAG TPA: BTAD domain-containing putative transcriptional regulator [Mycobacteriales bacterium]|nr:BTAD domain-containing putative transcriptional regulator [Mycobacteriales bacterium]
MDVLVLGPLEIRRDGEPVAVRRGRPRRLLLSLVVRRGGAVPQETLIDQLWGVEPPVNAGNALQILISYLRKSLRGAGLAIDRAPTGYRLVVEADAVDMWVFERLVDQVRSPGVSAPDRLDLVSRALALWRGPALSEAVDDPFAQGDIVRLDELRLQAFEARTAALLDLGRHEEALPDLTQLVRENPFREALHGQFALALYRAGRQADALRALEQARNALVDELGLDPSPELQRLGQRILRQDSALDPAQPKRAAVTVAGEARASQPSGPGGGVQEVPVTVPAQAAGPAPEGDPDPAGSDPAAGGLRPPTALTSLIGREEQVEAIDEALGAHRVVTLTGPGGAGKSRLAAACAFRRGPAWWADLSGATDGAALHEAVTAAVGTVRSSDDAAADIARWIGATDALLVLDTCEHLADAAGALARGLVAACPGLRVLATSRQPLGVPGELAWPVPPLSLPDPDERRPAAIAESHAVQLFADRARLARPGFEVTADNARDVASACLLLDGLPLAIELAAGHVAALSPAKIVALLGDRMRLLGTTGSRRDRHAGLRAAIDRSYELLSDEESLFLERLSVFAGPFPLEAAAEVAGADLDADGLSLLLSLVRQSLVAVAGEDHFRLLDTIGAYATARLAERPEQAAAARERHARYFAQFAEDADRNIRGADQAGWLAELRTAGPDLRAALRHCLKDAEESAALGARMVCSLSWFWSHEGSFQDARGWVELARAGGPHDPLTDARLHLAAGMHAESVGDLALAEAECRSAAAQFAGLGDRRGEARSLLHVGTALWASGRLDEAAAAQDRAVALFRAARHDSGAGLGLVLRARTAVDQDDSESAHDMLADAAHVLDRAGDEHLIGLCLEQRARTYMHDGRAAEAEQLAERGLRIFERVGYAEGAVAALQTLGSARLAAGDGAEAARLLADATRRALDLGHAPAIAEAMDLLAEAEALADPEAAARLAGHADALRRRTGLALTKAQERRREQWESRLRESLADRWERERARGAEAPAVDLLCAVLTAAA